MAPTIPRRVVLINPIDCAPGMTARATRPTTKPTMMCQMMCSIGFLRLDPATVQGRVAPGHHFSAPWQTGQKPPLPQVSALTAACACVSPRGRECQKELAPAGLCDWRESGSLSLREKV